MAQNESRYTVLRDLIYPKSYFDGVSGGDVIEGWSPNNLRRIFIFTNRVYVQWYVNCNKLEGKNPFLNYNGAVLKSGAIRYKDFGGANDAAANDLNYTLPAILDIVFKSGRNDGYKLANIEEVIFVNNKFERHDGRNYRTYKVDEFIRYIGVTELDINENEFLQLLVKNDDKPVCEWGNAKLVVPNTDIDGMCIIQDRKLFNKNFYTHAPDDKKVRNVQGIGKNNGVTYALDKVLRKKLEKIRDDYLQELEDRELENEKSLIDKQIYARKINKAFNSLILNKISKIKYLQVYRERIVDGELYKSINKDVYSYCKKIAFAVVSNVYHDVVVPITDKNNNLITEKIYMNAVSAADSRKEFEYEYYLYVVDFANKHGIYLGKITDNFDMYLNVLLIYQDILAYLCIASRIRNKVGVYSMAYTAVVSYKNNIDKLSIKNISDVSKLLDYSYGNGQSEFVYTLDNKDMFIFKLVDYVMSSKGSSYTEDIDLFRERYKNRIDFDKVVEIVKDKIGVSNIKELNTDEIEIFDALCLYSAYYVLLVKYVKHDALKWVNIARIKAQGVVLRHYLVISQVVSEYIDDEDISEIINAFSERINVEDDNNDKFSNKGEIHNMYEEIKKIGGMLNGE